MEGCEHPIPSLEGDFSLNAANALSADALLRAGLSRLSPTHDCNAAQLAALAAALGSRAAQLEVWRGARGGGGGGWGLEGIGGVAWAGRDSLTGGSRCRAGLGRAAQLEARWGGGRMLCVWCDRSSEQ